jgi:hydrophobic/amphiphilic exporter-1 (mainly G- bacteria), HAE1 family
MSDFFIRRPIVAIVIAILTVLLGVIALLGLPIAQFPQILPPQVNITSNYAGADAVTVEQAVATPIEQQMNGVDRSLYIQSTNGNDGSMNQVVTFDVGTDPDVNTVLVNNRFAQAQTALPQDVKNSGVSVKKSLAFPLMVIGLYSPDGRYDPTFLANYAAINMNDALLRVRGIGEVRNLGAGEYSMRIWLKPDVLARLGISVLDVQGAIRQQNIVNPAGQVGAEPAPAGQQLTYTVRAQGRLVEAEEFGEIILRENADGSHVMLKDVARVELGALSYQQYGMVNGKPASIIATFQMPGSNALDVADGIRNTLAELAKNFPPGIEYKITLDTTAPVRAGIEEILVTLLEAVLLVALVVFAFLQSWRATLIPLLTVPVSLIGAFAFFPLLGFSINTLSLFGLVLAIGLVVDDSIVVVEAVEHHIDNGHHPREATRLAMAQVQGPVVAIALILAAVFIPVAFMSGITGRLYQQFALTIAISVLISAFNALTLSPALAAMLLRPKTAPRTIVGRFGASFNRGFGRATETYLSINRRLIRKLAIPLLLLLAITGLSVVLGQRLPTGFVPDEDQGYAIVSVQLPDGASLQRTRAVYSKVHAILAKQPGIRAFNSTAGFSFLTRTNASYVGTTFVNFKPWPERESPELAATEIVRSLNRAFAALPEARVLAIAPAAIPGISATGGFSFMLQDRAGGPYERLAEQTQAFLAEARKRPELENVRANFSPAVPQLFLEVDKDKAMKHRVPIGEIYATLQTFLGGAYVNDFTRFGRQWRVFAQADPSYRRSAEDITKFYVRNLDQQMVPLSSFAQVRTSSGPEFIMRFNLYRAVEIQGAAAPSYSSGQALTALEDVASKVLSADMGYAYNGLAYQEKAASGSSVRVLGLSLVFVFLILAALYESWSLPLSVLLSTPVAVLGALLGLLAREFDNNVYAQIGLVMLVGLTAKNAILIVEFAKVVRDSGRPIVEAALQGARSRLRPILMTSFAFIFGCLPLWFAAGAGAAARRMLGTAVVSGMLAATLFGIFLIPALYVFVERIASRNAEPDRDESMASGGAALSRQHQADI